jgi:hypothetical protein
MVLKRLLNLRNDNLTFRDSKERSRGGREGEYNETKTRSDEGKGFQ